MCNKKHTYMYIYIIQLVCIMCNNKYTYMYSISILCMEVYGIVLKYNIYIILYTASTQSSRRDNTTRSPQPWRLPATELWKGCICLKKPVGGLAKYICILDQCWSDEVCTSIYTYETISKSHGKYICIYIYTYTWLHMYIYIRLFARVHLRYWSCLKTVDFVWHGYPSLMKIS